VYVSFESIVHKNVWPLYRNTRVVHAQWSVESYWHQERYPHNVFRSIFNLHCIYYWYIICVSVYNYVYINWIERI